LPCFLYFEAFHSSISPPKLVESCFDFHLSKGKIALVSSPFVIHPKKVLECTFPYMKLTQREVLVANYTCGNNLPLFHLGSTIHLGSIVLFFTFPPFASIYGTYNRLEHMLVLKLHKLRSSSP
jgi:hypothetical protein